MEGDRTMLDALLPFARELRQHSSSHLHETLASAADAADRGVQATAAMQARAGRSSYLGDRTQGVPDPGARAAAIWLRAVSELLQR
jgi:dihydroxyacetone kinase